MTVFHDDVMALTPGVFVPLDAPGDTSTTAQDLMGDGLMVDSTAGAKSAAAGDVAFTNELDCASTYWVADATLESRIISLLAGTDEFTFACWWRTTQPTSDATARVMLALTEDGVRLYRQSGNIVGTYYNAAASPISLSGGGTPDAANGGGWQTSGLLLDPADNGEILARSGGYSRFSQVADGSTVRTSGANAFWLGATSGGASGWIGSLGPFAIWDRCLTPAEWSAWYYAGLGITAEDEASYPYLRRSSEQRMSVGRVVERSGT